MSFTFNHVFDAAIFAMCWVVSEPGACAQSKPLAPQGSFIVQLRADPQQKGCGSTSIPHPECEPPPANVEAFRRDLKEHRVVGQPLGNLTFWRVAGSFDDVEWIRSLPEVECAYRRVTSSGVGHK